jgi:threonine dehydrogenase-like Zn-dependent dehydrogenase
VEHAVDLPVLQEYQMGLQGSATYLWDDFDRAMEIIADLAADRFVSATFPIDRTAEAFAAISSGNEVKILVVGDGKAS